MSGRVAELLISASAGQPMQSRREVELIAGVGVVGDRYASKRGHWSDPRWPDQELTLIMAEVAERLEIPARSLRRNVVTRGVQLDDLIGATFAAGETLLYGVRRCDPCRYIERFSREGALRELASCGGLRARILRGGRLRVGDGIRVIDAEVAGSVSAPVTEGR